MAKHVTIDQMIKRLQKVREEHGNVYLFVEFDRELYEICHGIDMVMEDMIGFERRKSFYIQTDI